MVEIDLQCEQLEECKIKIGSLNQLLQVHSLSPVDMSDDPSNCIINYNRNEEPAEVLKNSPSQKGVSMFSENDLTVYENLLESEECLDFNLKIPFLEFGQEITIRDVKYIPHLVHNSNNERLSSPSLGFREEKFVIKNISCPDAFVNCCVCVSPELHAAAIRTKIAIGIIYAQRKNFKDSQHCFIKVCFFFLFYKLY